MKRREPRLPVLINARMRVTVSWADVSIRNISSRGMMLEMPAPPPRGTYIEIARGPLRITARVVWTEGSRCGLQTRERIDLGSLAHGREPEPAAEAYAPSPSAAPRRRVDQNVARNQARATEFAVILLFAGALIGALVVPAYEMVAATMQEVESKL